MAKENTKLEKNTWFEDFGPMHDFWIRFERGIQIVLGVALITIFGFLGESWGGENVPYDEIMKGVLRVSWAFLISILLTPTVLMFGMIASKTLPFSRGTRGRLYFVVLLTGLGYCMSLLYISTNEIIRALINATKSMT